MDYITNNIGKGEIEKIASLLVFQGLLESASK